MSLPLVIVATSAQTVLNSISLVARYRFVPREQDEGFQPLIRVEYQQPLTNYDAYTPAYVQRVPQVRSLLSGANIQLQRVPFPPELKVLFALTYGSLNSVRATLNVGAQFGLPFLQTSSEPRASPSSGPRAWASPCHSGPSFASPRSSTGKFR